MTTCLYCHKEIKGMVCSNLNNETWHPKCFDKTPEGKKMNREFNKFKDGYTKGMIIGTIINL
jgi:uncharacterized protein YgfB (UPF0149 family)